MRRTASRLGKPCSPTARPRAWRDHCREVAGGDLDPAAPVFNLKPHTKCGRAVAEYRVAAGVEYRTDDGRCTFHALRHTYITRLDAHGVAPSLKQQLARHKTPGMTDRYTHTAPRLLAAASKAIPARRAASKQRKVS